MFQIILESEDHDAAEQVDGYDDGHGGEACHILSIVHTQLCCPKQGYNTNTNLFTR